jgi:4a-hydroxytetrahydrobiopterin dehydratase
MIAATADQLRAKRCLPCEGGVAPLSPAEAASQLQALHGWQLSPDRRGISKQWQVKDFLTAIDFFDRLAQLAEAENHHPDLHLEGYRRVRVELSTHAIGGLSENDFILAAKIDELPLELKVG